MWKRVYLDSCDLFRSWSNYFRSLHLICGVLSIQLSRSKCFNRYLLCLFLRLLRVKLLRCCNSLLQNRKNISQGNSETERTAIQTRQWKNMSAKAFHGVHASNSWKSSQKSCLFVPFAVSSPMVHSKTYFGAIPKEMNKQPVGNKSTNQAAMQVLSRFMFQKIICD